jgi:hypothetical protein
MSRSRIYSTQTDSRRQLNLAKQNEIINEELAGLHDGNVSAEASKIKKEFVEPTISVPVDVLEATTFFQATTSHVTN